MASVNHSIESNTSSLQRSGLNMSVGDTKSIVLALQALQDKIRRLEQDRNHHQDQYEQALRAHEAYKHDMEHQLEQERSAHRQRERELQDMVQRATAEKAKLQMTLDESRKDLGTFRTELEEMLVKECDAAQKRENALSSEVGELRREVEEQHKKHRALVASIEELRAEKEAALDTNHHLEQAIQELMRLPPTRTAATAAAVDRSHAWNGDSTILTAGGSRRVGRRLRPNTAAAAPAPVSRRNGCRRSAEPRPRDSRPPSAQRSLAARRTYRDPTYSSMQRDLRKDDGCRVADDSFRSEFARPAPHVAMSASRTQPPAGGLDARQSDAMAEVRHELEEELKSLHQQYKEMVERAAAEEISAEVVTAAVNRLATLMDRKTEQIKLVKEAQHDLVAAGVAVEVPTSRPHSAPKRRSNSLGLDKTTRRKLIVNELRSLFSQQRQ